MEPDDEYPCDDTLFSRVEPESNTITLQSTILSQAPPIHLNSVTSQRFAGLSRRLTANLSLPYPFRRVPSNIFLLYLPLEGFSMPSASIWTKRDYLHRLCKYTLATNPDTKKKLLSNPFHLDATMIHTLLPPHSQLRNNGDLGSYATRRYRHAWPASLLPPASKLDRIWFTCTGLAEILEMDHHKDIWIILADRGSDFADWQRWAGYMRKCTGESMFGVAFRSALLASHLQL